MKLTQQQEDLLTSWGRWASGGGGAGVSGSPGLEGRFRDNRCEECYELDGPCASCEKTATVRIGGPVYSFGMEVVEKVVNEMDRTSRDVLVLHFVKKRPPGAIGRIAGFPKESFSYRLFVAAGKVCETLKGRGYVL